MFSLERVILAILLGTMSRNLIGWESVHIHWSGTFSRSLKLWGTIPSKVTTCYCVQSNQNRYFYRTSQRIRKTCLREWRRCFRKPFCFDFSSERKFYITHCRNSKYDAYQEIRYGHPESRDVCEPKNLSSQRAIKELIRSVTGEGEFSNSDSLLELREGRRDGQKIRYDVNNAKLKELFADLDATNCRLILCVKNTDVWLNWYSTSGYRILWFFMCTLLCCRPKPS